MYLPSSLAILATTASLAAAQYPAAPSGITSVKSKVDPKVTISWKETDICPQPAGSKTYSGYVHLPGSILADVGGFDLNTYFLYFEARNNPSTAPLAIYFAGGPGEASSYSALSSESGPCYVDPTGTSTINNPWSFNTNANVLYIDQPSGAGFSYSGELVKSTYDVATSLITPLDGAAPPLVNASLGYGLFADPAFDHTVATTVEASRAVWHFAEHWLSSFPGYRTSSDKISVWGNSAGGFWVPAVAALFRRNFASLSSTHPLKTRCPNGPVVDVIGITDGEIDIATSVAGWPLYAYNNTYGIEFINEKTYETAMHDINKPNGCLDQVSQCRELGELSDPDFIGKNSTVNKACMASFAYCAEKAVFFPKVIKVNAFDIAQPAYQPCGYYLPVNTFLNSATVQAELGVPANWSYISNAVLSNFGVPNVYTDRPIAEQSGDFVRQNGMPDIDYLLGGGVKVAFIYGDRDYRCPWTGGLENALSAKWNGQSGFASAGFTELTGSARKGQDHGAIVKQYGQFSFSRVFDSGHAVSSYAPETVFKIFDRTLNGLDAATGEVTVGDGYRTEGPTDSWSWRNVLPKKQKLTCMVEGEWTKTNPWAGVISPA